MVRLKDIRLLIDAREDDTMGSWTDAAVMTYKEVLEHARSICPPGRHIMTLAEYIELWRQTVQGGSRACNEADVWARFEQDRQESDPISFVRHPFLSTVLVDTWLSNFTENNGAYEAEVIVGGKPKGRINIPNTGKIYQVNSFGLPSQTGGKKIQASDAFEHRWWALSSDEIKTNGKVNQEFIMALFGNGGTTGCFCELIKAHYSIDDRGGFYRVLTLPDAEK